MTRCHASTTNVVLPDVTVFSGCAPEPSTHRETSPGSLSVVVSFSPKAKRSRRNHSNKAGDRTQHHQSTVFCPLSKRKFDTVDPQMTVRQNFIIDPGGWIVDRFVAVMLSDLLSYEDTHRAVQRLCNIFPCRLDQDVVTNGFDFDDRRIDAQIGEGFGGLLGTSL